MKASNRLNLLENKQQSTQRAQSLAIPFNTYEKAAASRFRTRMTRIARIFTDTCSSASFPLSMFYRIYSLIDEDKNPQISQIRADLSNVGSDIKGTMKPYTCSRETGSRWFCPAIYSLRKSAQSVDDFSHDNPCLSASSEQSAFHRRLSAFICVYLRLIFVSLSDRTRKIQSKLSLASSSQSVFNHGVLQ